MVGIILGIGMFSLGIAMLVVLTTTSALIKNKNLNSGNQSFFTAESAVREGVYQTINSHLAYAGGTQVMLNNSTSDSDIQVFDLGWQEVQVLGTSHSRLTEREISYILNIFPAGAVFDHAVYAQNILKLSGSADIINGSIFANSDIIINSELGFEEDMDMYIGSTMSDDTHIGDITLHENVTKLDPPEVNLTHYYEIAEEKGTLFSDITLFNNYLSGGGDTPDTITDEIIYIYGVSEIDITDVDFSGTLIVVGNLSISHSTFSQSDLLDDPLVIYVTGSLSLGAKVVIEGIIYTEDFDFENSASPIVKGSIIVAGADSNLALTSNITIIYEEYDLAQMNFVETTGGTPTITNWSE